MIYVYSGLGPGKTGTGQLVKYIQGVSDSPNIKFLGNEPPHFWSLPWRIRNKLNRSLEKKIKEKNLAIIKDKKPDQLVLLHPQTLGFVYLKRVVEVSIRKKIRLKLYLLDNSYFCVRSYNFRNDKECIACIAEGPISAKKYNCQPFPDKSISAFEFRKWFKEYVRKGHIELFFQSQSQRKLAEKWFQMSFDKQYEVGMWTYDLEKSFQEVKNGISKTTNGFDFVFHGSQIDAKGASWALELAERMDEYSFFFPFNKPSEIAGLTNCVFKDMQWDSGLKEMVSTARCTLVPSLWSAPVEGALIKSIMYSSRVLALATKYGFAKEDFAPNLYLSSPNVSEAATYCEQLLNKLPVPKEEDVFDWVNSFRSSNRIFFDKLVKH